MDTRFYGMDQYDLDQQIWTWRSENPHFKVRRIHPTEDIPLTVSDRRPGQKIQFKKRVSVLVEYGKDAQ